MFLCDKCHDPECPRYDMEDMFRSMGACEECGNTTACYDCQGYKVAKPKKKAKRRLN